MWSDPRVVPRSKRYFKRFSQCPLRAPTLRPAGIATTGRVARELPVASALLFRRDIAQKASVDAVGRRCWPAR
jgi:hypothetical protein